MQLCSSLLPLEMIALVSIPVNLTFIAGFIAVDQLLCLVCSIGTLEGPSTQYSKTRMAKSVLFGFLNCKTFFLVLFIPLAFTGFRINLLFIVLDWCFGLTERMSQAIGKLGSSWCLYFYLQHRMSHLPRVYEEAHKQHHHLHDATAFDAHIYGSGQAG